MSPHWALLTDGSVDPATGIGVGGYLFGRSDALSKNPNPTSVCLRQFNSTTAARLELQTVLWALQEIPPTDDALVVYTDSQTIVGLPERRARLVKTGFRSGKGALLRQHDLYLKFYDTCDTRAFAIQKIRGHQPSSAHTGLASAFALVDRATRQALRNTMT